MEVAEIPRHIYFVSPKVHRAAQQSIEIFARLREEYPTINWHLFTNETFVSEVLSTTLEKGGTVADTTELFLRSFKLLQLGEFAEREVGQRTLRKESRAIETSMPVVSKDPTYDPVRFQPLVRGLLRTLLDDYPGLLTQSELDSLMESEYCKSELGLNIGNLPLLRRAQDGRDISGHGRYWKDVYGGGFYVCSQWWKEHHAHNAESLRRWVKRLVESLTSPV